MRSHEERIEEVKRRIEKKRRQKKLRRNLAVAVSGIAACLVVIVGVSMSRLIFSYKSYYING